MRVSSWERVGLLASGPGEGRELGQEGRRGKDWARAGFLGRVSVGFGFEFWFFFFYFFSFLILILIQTQGK